MSDSPGIVTTTICMILMLVAATLFVKICGSEIREFRDFFHGILVAAFQELTFRGGRAAKANIALCLILGILFVFISLPDELAEVRSFLAGTPEHGIAKYLLLGALLIFFLVSLCFVYASDRYSRKAQDR